jgi:hypothetical protein
MGAKTVAGKTWIPKGTPEIAFVTVSQARFNQALDEVVMSLLNFICQLKESNKLSTRECTQVTSTHNLVVGLKENQSL